MRERSRRIHLRASGSRFTSGGGTVNYMITIDPAMGLVMVREARRRDFASITIDGLARMVMDRHYTAKARVMLEEKASKRRRARGGR